MSEKILLMSDIHITEAGVDIFGLNPADRFRLCLEDAIEHHEDARHLFLMGDLTEHGYHDEYQILEEMLKRQPFEFTLMLGNHDRRSMFLKAFPNLIEGFQQGSKKFGKTTILYLDTLDEDAKNLHGGLLCQERLRWLETNLSSGSTQILILAHHHMLTSGFDALDEINLLNGRPVAELIAASGCCQMVISGHVHRTLVSTFKGVTHTMIKSPCHQMPMVLGSGGLYPSVSEPGGYGVLLLDGEIPILHHVDVGLPIGGFE
jgi:3',5'-cyclic AMP phosphodiesterase CpdA